MKFDFFTTSPICRSGLKPKKNCLFSYIRFQCMQYSSIYLDLLAAKAGLPVAPLNPIEFSSSYSSFLP